MKSAQKGLHKISRIFMLSVSAVVFIVFFILTLRGTATLPGADFIGTFAGRKEKILICMISCGFFFLFSGFLKRVLSDLPDAILKVLMALAAIIAVLIQAFFLFYIRSTYKWDTAYVIGAASSLVDNGKIIGKDALYYMSVYPNNNGFVCFTAILVRLCGLFGIAVPDRPLFFNTVLTILTDISICLIIPTAERVRMCKFGLPDKCRYFILLLLNPFLYTGVSYYYTVSLSLIFTSVFCYIAAGLFNKDEEEQGDKKEWIYYVVCGLILGLGYVIRPTAVIFMTAFVIVLILRGKGYIKLICFIFTAVLTVCLATGLSASYVGLDTKDTAFPAKHWIMMSLTPPGGHNAEDEEYTASYATKEEKKEAVDKRLKEKLDELGAAEVMEIAALKISRTFGDGSNGYLTYLGDAYGTGEIYDYVFGSHRDFFVILNEGYYLFMQIWMLFACARFFIFNSAKERDEVKAPFSPLSFEGVLILILLGAVMFYVLWEASEQYSVPFLGVMYILSFAGMDEIQKTYPFIKRGIIKKLARLAFVVVTLVYGIFTYRQYTCTPAAFEKICADQILANNELTLDDGETLIQHLKLRQPYNRFVMQWRNYVGQDNDAVYDVRILREGVPVLYDEIKASSSAYMGVYSVGIPTINSEAGLVNGEYDYTVEISKKSGLPDNDLKFVTYDMYGFRPYPGGELEIVRNGDNPSDEGIKSGSGELSRDMSLTFSFTENESGFYMSEKRYCILLLSVFVAGLLFALVGKEVGVGVEKDAEKDNVKMEDMEA